MIEWARVRGRIADRQFIRKVLGCGILDLYGNGCISAGLDGTNGATPSPSPESTVEQPSSPTPGPTASPTLFALLNNCALRHNLLVDATGEDVSIEASWRATMMANAVRDPYFQAKVSAESARSPALRTVIEATCSTCHTRMARTQKLAAGQSVSPLDSGFLDPNHPLHAEAMDGVSCTGCQQFEGEPLNVALRVSNLAGHKLPTGFPSRRVWIHLKVVDASGATIFESGAPPPDGRISGNAADQDRASIEPNYRTITQDDQVQVYETVMANSDGEVTFTLLRAARYRKDNRLLPRGFD